MVDHVKSLERAKQNLKESDILEVNKKHILDFIDLANKGKTRGGDKGISKRRQFKYCNQLRKMAAMLDIDSVSYTHLTLPTN